MKHFEIIRDLEKKIQNLSSSFENYQVAPGRSRSEDIRQIIASTMQNEDDATKARVVSEFDGYGPLETIFHDTDITEILVNGAEQIWFEKKGKLEKLEDGFASALSYRNFCHRLLHESQCCLTSESPTAHGHFKNFRLHIIGSELTKSQISFCLRRHPENPWTFQKLAEQSWGTAPQRSALENLIASRVNFVVVGATGSGKTSVLNACLQSLRPEERCVLIEDTLELKIPNTASLRLLTREDPNGILKTINQSDLVKNSLRLRPDRIVMGEVRGEEAKDFLMALSTGHAGSFGSLHAASAAQALIRLEMLIQLGAPHWNLVAIRRLIQMSLQAIVVVGRSKDGQRCLEGIYRLSSLEENGILLEKVS